MSNGFYVDFSTMSDDVTGSCTLLSLYLPDGNVQRIIIDCGLFLERETKWKNTKFHFDPKEIDACVITHAHIDHIGRLPLLMKEGYRGKIHCTKESEVIIPIALDDNFKIMCRDAKNGNGNGNRLYEEIHVERVKRKLQSYGYEKKVKLTPNIDLFFIRNGHLFGAAVVYLKCSYYGYDDINIVFSGDYKKNNSFFKTAKRLPFGLSKRRVNLVTETTYGASFSDEIEYNFFDEVSKAVEKRKRILIPAFSLGRTQEVLLFLKHMQDLDYIPDDYPIYYDGKLGRKYLELAKKKLLGITKNKDFIPKNFTIIGDDKNMKLKDERQNLMTSNGPAIIVASAGNGSYGPSNAYLRAMIEANVTIIFTGYCTEGTVGRILIEAVEGEKIDVFGETFIKRANIIFTRQFSAHAYADELLEFIAQFGNLVSV